jgi:hypothetical protein
MKAHVKRDMGLMGFSCSCGTQWKTDKLRGKTDEDLEAERDEEFRRHVAAAIKADKDR